MNESSISPPHSRHWLWLSVAGLLDNNTRRDTSLRRTPTFLELCELLQAPLKRTKHFDVGGSSIPELACDRKYVEAQLRHDTLGFAARRRTGGWGALFLRLTKPAQALLNLRHTVEHRRQRSRDTRGDVTRNPINEDRRE